MPGIDIDFMRGFNIVFLVIASAVLLGLGIGMGGRTSALQRADRYSLRVRLPYGNDAMREAVARVLRARWVGGVCALGVGMLVSWVLVFTPLGASPMFLFTPVTFFVAGIAFSTTVVSVRERLFHPAPAAPRIARARAMTTADYLDPARRRIPAIVAAVAVVALAAAFAVRATRPGTVDDLTLGGACVFAGIGLVAFLALPRLERLLLSRPQPASDTLELAWDDALRAGALMSLRLSCALAAWFVIAQSLIATWRDSAGGWGALLLQLPTWGMIGLEFLYPADGRLLPTRLYPDWLLRPSAPGGAA